MKTAAKHSSGPTPPNNLPGLNCIVDHLGLSLASIPSTDQAAAGTLGVLTEAFAEGWGERCKLGEIIPGTVGRKALPTRQTSSSS